jgi:hypothetical protein
MATGQFRKEQATLHELGGSAAFTPLQQPRGIPLGANPEPMGVVGLEAG